MFSLYIVVHRFVTLLIIIGFICLREKFYNTFKEKKNVIYTNMYFCKICTTDNKVKIVITLISCDSCN